MQRTINQLAILAVSAAAATGCGSGGDPGPARFCGDATATELSGDEVLPWGGTLTASVAGTVGSVGVSWTGALPDGAWSTLGRLDVTQAGVATLWDAGGDATCLHDQWVELPVDAAFGTDDGSLDVSIAGVATVWGSGADEAEVVANIRYDQIGEPYASVVSQAESDAEAIGCTVGAPYDELLVTGTLSEGAIDFWITRSCDEGDRLEDVASYPMVWQAT